MHSHHLNLKFTQNKIQRYYILSIHVNPHKFASKNAQLHDFKLLLNYPVSNSQIQTEYNFTCKILRKQKKSAREKKMKMKLKGAK